MIGTIASLEKKKRRKIACEKILLTFLKFVCICLSCFVSIISLGFKPIQKAFMIKDKGKPTIEFDHLTSLRDLKCTMHRFASFSNCFTLCYAADAVLAA